jgi:DNA-binding NarL/FixJ family response regulator
MKKDLNIIIVEDDPYARDFMSLLLRKDWRTRVIGEFGSHAAIELQHALHQQSTHADVLIIDTEVPDDEAWPVKVAQIIRSLPVAHMPVVLYTCTAPNERVLSHILDVKGSGYIAKAEILYALASAVSAAASGKFVLTPGTHMLAGDLDLPEATVIMDGTLPPANFTLREKELTRLGLLFNLAQRDIADDLVISTDFVAEVMGQIYEKLGLREILSGEKALETYFEDEKLLARCRDILQQVPASAAGKLGRKAPWMSTLAFHLLTIPGITEIDLGKDPQHPEL